jgi:hypothetical protein
MDRRAFLGSAASTLVLPGCTTVGARSTPARAAGCLPKVDVSPERVIRTVGGLRPYRRAGFVVRADALGRAGHGFPEDEVYRYDTLYVETATEDDVA